MSRGLSSSSSPGLDTLLKLMETTRTDLDFSVHAVFEGMAIGLEKHPMDIWILFAGNMANNLCIKIALIISLGNSMFLNSYDVRIFAQYSCR